MGSTVEGYSLDILEGKIYFLISKLYFFPLVSTNKQRNENTITWRKEGYSGTSVNIDVVEKGLRKSS